MPDQIKSIQVKFNLLISNIDDSIAIASEKVSNLDRKQKVDGIFDALGDIELKFLILKEREDNEELWRSYLAMRKAYEDYVEELLQVFEDVMAEEYKRQILEVSTEETTQPSLLLRKGPGRPPKTALLPEGVVKSKKGKKRGHYVVATPEEKIELIKKAYMSLEPGGRSVSRIAKTAGLPYSTAYGYIKQLDLKLDGQVPEAFKRARNMKVESEDEKVEEEVS